MTTPGTPGWSRAKRATSRAATREAVIDAALALFAEKGYVGVRVEDIAKAAGLSRATFYKHFSEREEILDELFRRLLGDEPPAVDRDAAVSAEVQRVLGEAARHMLGDETLARFVYTLPVRHAAVVGARAATPRVFDSIAALVAAGVERGEVRADVPVDALVEALHRAFEAAMRDWAEGRTDDAPGRVRLLADIVLHGAMAT